jgi:hypothetical protein
MDLEQRIKKRYFLIKNIEKIITESVYYRNNSKNISGLNKITIANINDNKSKKKIL